MCIAITDFSRAGQGFEKRTDMYSFFCGAPVEWEYYRHGGILPMVLRRLAAG